MLLRTFHGVALMADGLEILDEAECRRLLAQARVGRVIIVRGTVPAVFPVCYVVVGGDIVFFTGTGTKLAAALAGMVVSFEADEVDFDHEVGWSVLAVGPATLASHVAADRARSLGCVPWAAGSRHHAVRIRPEFLSGRRIPGKVEVPTSRDLRP